MKRSGWLVALAVGCACAAVRLRPVERDWLTRVRVELDGGDCSYEVTPLDVGVCLVRAVDSRPRRSGLDGLVRCGETAMVCERSVPCDCSQPKRVFDCEPERTVIVHADGGLTPVFPTRADGTPIPPLAGRRFEGSNEFGTCLLRMYPPRLGRCSIGAIIPNESPEWMATGLYVPFGEERELCGVRLSCRCGEFTERE